MSPALLFALALSAAARGQGLETDAVRAGAAFDDTRLLTSAAPAQPSETQRLALDALFKSASGAAAAWPGYDFLATPVLAVLKDGSAILVGHPAPPPEFRPVQYAGRLVYVADKGPDMRFSYNTRYDFAGAQVMAVRAESVLKEAVPLMQLAIHERFHLYQREWTKSRRTDYDVEAPEDVALAEMENRALTWWMERRDAEAMRDFAALRQERRRLFPGTHAETEEENLEGTARYVEAAGLAAAKDKDASDRLIVEDLKRPVVIQNMAKWRLYAVGAALSRFLESQAPGAWQGQVQSGRRVSELALQRLAVGGAEASGRVARLTSSADYAAALTSARAGIAALARRRRDALAAFDAQPGLRVRLEPPPSDRGKGGYSSDDDGTIEFPDGSILFEPVIEYVGPAFVLQDLWVRDGAEGLEFFLAPGAKIAVDGAPWTPVPGAKEFKSLSVEARGVRVDAGAGALDFDGRVLTIRLR